MVYNITVYVIFSEIITKLDWNNRYLLNVDQQVSTHSFNLFLISNIKE